MLKELRSKRNYTQEELSELLDIARISYIRYENGERTPPIPIFNKICEVLKLSNKQKAELLMSFDKKGSE